MVERSYDRLLSSLEIDLHAFALCEIAEGVRLRFDPMNVVLVHYVLQGSGFLESRGHAVRPVGPGSIIVVPPGLSQSLICAGPASRDVAAAENCVLLDDGLLKFDAADGADGTLRVICSTISASYGGSFGLFDFLLGPSPVTSSTLPPSGRPSTS